MQVFDAFLIVHEKEIQALEVVLRNEFNKFHVSVTDLKQNFF